MKKIITAPTIKRAGKRDTRAPYLEQNGWSAKKQKNLDNKCKTRIKSLTFRSRAQGIRELGLETFGSWTLLKTFSTLTTRAKRLSYQTATIHSRLRPVLDKKLILTASHKKLHVHPMRDSSVSVPHWFPRCARSKCFFLGFEKIDCAVISYLNAPDSCPDTCTIISSHSNLQFR